MKTLVQKHACKLARWYLRKHGTLGAITYENGEWLIADITFRGVTTCKEGNHIEVWPADEYYRRAEMDGE